MKILTLASKYLTHKKEGGIPVNDSKLVPYGKQSGKGMKVAEKIETDDMTAILDMAIEASTARVGRPAEYPYSRAGLDAFIDKTLEFFQYVNDINANPDLERKLIPDIESWGVFLGVTRQTIWAYEKRGGEWKATIEYYKNAIAAVKKQLALNYKIPPMVYVFDATNNHGYVNSNEFKLTQGKPETENKDNVDEQIRAAGLVWNEDLQEFEPMEG